MATKSPLEKFGLLIVPFIFVIYALSFWASMSRNAVPTEAARYPRGLIVLLLVLITLAGVRDFARATQQSDVRIAEVWGRWAPTVSTSVLLIVYALAITRIGFYLASAAFSVSLLLVLGVRSAPRIAALTGGYLAGIYVIFDRLLQVRLPS